MIASVTPKMQECLDLLAQRKAANAIGPSFEEIRVGLGLKSKSGVARLINALKERGHIRTLRGPDGSPRRRAIELIERPTSCAHCGRPVDA